ncbi:hypothetical protein B0T09DRAFT_329300 [Sordaria sp. MPI-SDFR-AT-0083]|nr:hypothetical protein B0T09DRAFT_329300 [Sordaria sp. MPI-SDFR-AT-0083]
MLAAFFRIEVVMHHLLAFPVSHSCPSSESFRHLESSGCPCLVHFFSCPLSSFFRAQALVCSLYFSIPFSPNPSESNSASHSFVGSPVVLSSIRVEVAG